MKKETILPEHIYHLINLTTKRITPVYYEFCFEQITGFRPRPLIDELTSMIQGLHDINLKRDFKYEMKNKCIDGLKFNVVRFRRK